MPAANVDAYTSAQLRGVLGWRTFGPRVFLFAKVREYGHGLHQDAPSAARTVDAKPYVADLEACDESAAPDGVRSASPDEPPANSAQRQDQSRPVVNGRMGWASESSIRLARPGADEQIKAALMKKVRSTRMQNIPSAHAATSAILMAPPPRVRGPATQRLHTRRLREGFFSQYLSGHSILDIGYRGGIPNAVPIVDHAIGVDLDYPGYDGTHLPFSDYSQDAIFASHSLEHIANYREVLGDWYRVLKIGGYLIIVVPHRYLYERKATLPSRFNPDHKRFYTSGSLLAEIDDSFPISGFRIRSLREIDDGFNYSSEPWQHPVGGYDIELVLQRIEIPSWIGSLTLSESAQADIACYAALLRRMMLDQDCGIEMAKRNIQIVATIALPPFAVLVKELGGESGFLKGLLKPFVAASPFDAQFYQTQYEDVRRAVTSGTLSDLSWHFVNHGYFEGRIGALNDIWR